MDSASTNPVEAGPPAPQPVAWRAVVSLGAFKTLLHIVVALTAVRLGFGYHRDEFYYVTGGWRADLGYVDHPPLVPWLASGLQALLGESIFSLRVVSALAAGLLVVLTGLLTARLGGRAWAQTLAAAAAVACPINLTLFSLFQTPVFDQLIWAGAIVLFARIARTGGEPSSTDWIAFGAVAGLGLLTKYTVVVLGAAVVLALLLTPRLRPHLARPGLWIGGAIALAFATPNLLWQWRSGLPFLEFSSRVDRSAPWESVPLSLLFFGPATLALGAAGLRFSLQRGSSLRPLGWVAVSVIGLFVVLAAKPYYVASLFLLLFALGALAWQQRHESKRWPIVLVLSNLVMLPVFTPVVPLQFAEFHSNSPNEELAEMVGWENLVDEVERTARELSDAEIDGCRILAGNYGEAASLELLGQEHRLPKVLSGHNSYYYWSVGEPLDCALLVGFRQETVEQVWSDVRPLGALDNPWGIDNDERGRRVFLARGLLAPADDVWERLRNFG